MEAQLNKQPCVYLLASKRNGTLYVGVTSDLIKRVWEHKTHPIDGFTSECRVGALVRFELHETMEAAIRREKQLKKWRRAWKIRMIESKNASRRDLYLDLL